MPAEKELRRVLDIARTHARNALAKDATQRESYLGFCRAHWKRYAASFSKSEQECERFADEMDRATRALIALRNEFAALLSILPEGTAETDLGPVEGAMESVIVHEASIESPDLAAETESPGEKVEVAAPPPSEPVELDAKTLEQQRFEEMDRANARFGFTFPKPANEEPETEKPEADGELHRRVRSVLRSHQQTDNPPDNRRDRKSKRKA